MRLVVTQNVTLDGVIEAEDGWFAPANGGTETADLEASLREQTGGQDGLLLGRRTFEAFRGYWPQQTDDTSGVADHLDRVQKYVASRDLGEPGWANTTVLRGDLLDEVRRLKAAPGGDVCLTGSISVTHQVLAAGLVDELRLFTYPVVLGRGRRLFPDGTRLDGLRAGPVTSFRGGVVLLMYSTA